MTYILDSKTVIAADLDGTLALSKASLGDDMAETISKWLECHRFAIISGGKYEQFQLQVVSRLPKKTKFENLFLFPTNGAACYSYKDGVWVKVYEDTLDETERALIFDAIQKAVAQAEIPNEEIFGDQIEYRGGQVTYSALGQHAPLEKKAPWDPDQKKRLKIVSYLAPLLSNFNIGIGGTTSIDITQKGVDKEYALKKMKELLSVDNDHVVFLGDSIFEGGNDWPAVRAGVTTISVSGPTDSIKEIQRMNSAS